MDPITTAIVAALAKSLSQDVCKDSYVALKDALKKKFGHQSDLVDAVDKLEKNPDSEGRKTILQEEVEISKVNDDPDIRKLVQDLQDLIDQINKTKEQSRQPIIDQTQTNTISHVDAEGNIIFKPVQDNKS
jgi:hypothetical protein